MLWRALGRLGITVLLKKPFPALGLHPANGACNATNSSEAVKKTAASKEATGANGTVNANTSCDAAAQLMSVAPNIIIKDWIPQVSE